MNVVTVGTDHGAASLVTPQWLEKDTIVDNLGASGSSSNQRWDIPNTVQSTAPAATNDDSNVVTVTDTADEVTHLGSLFQADFNELLSSLGNLASSVGSNFSFANQPAETPDNAPTAVPSQSSGSLLDSVRADVNELVSSIGDVLANVSSLLPTHVDQPATTAAAGAAPVVPGPGDLDQLPDIVDVDAGPPDSVFNLQRLQKLMSLESFDDQVSGQKALEMATETAATGIAQQVSKRVAQDAMNFSLTEVEFKAFQAIFSARWAPSASAGETLNSRNDYAGILVIPARDPAVGVVSERLAVVKVDVSTESGQPNDVRYLVVGYGNRVVNMHELAEELRVLRPKVTKPIVVPKDPKDPTKELMETPFRAMLLDASKKSTLCIRRDLNESNQVLMPVPPNATFISGSAATWANYEHACLAGASKKDEHGNRPIYIDHSVVEDRILIFKDKSYGVAPRPTSKAAGGRPIDVKVDGPILCEIRGIKDLQITHGERGQTGKRLDIEPVRLVDKDGEPVEDDDRGETRVVITTKDGAKHELLLTDDGLRMKLLEPKGEAGSSIAFGVEDKIHETVNLYSYWGLNDGVKSTKDGYPDPRLVTSCGDHILCGPFMIDALSWWTATRRLAEGVGNLVTANIVLGQNSTLVAKMVNEVLNTAVKGCFALASNAIVNTYFRNPATGTIFTGSTIAFGSVAVGATSGGVLFASLMTMMASHAAVTALGSVLGNFFPRPWEAEDSKIGFALSELVGPWLGEIMRLSLNMGLQVAFGLPRGSAGDAISVLALGTASFGLSKFKDYAISDDNWVLEAMMDGMEYLSNTGFRALGNAWSDLGNLDGQAFAEALTTRALVRLGDKLIIPVATTVLTGWGLMGLGASAFDHQVAREAQDSSWIAKMRVVIDAVNKSAGKLERSIGESGFALACLDMVDAYQKWVNEIIIARNAPPQSTDEDNEIKAVDQSVTATQQMAKPAQLAAEEQLERAIAGSLHISGLGAAMPQPVDAATQQQEAANVQAQFEQVANEMLESLTAYFNVLASTNGVSYRTEDLNKHTIERREKMAKAAEDGRLTYRLPDGRLMGADGKYVVPSDTTFSVHAQEPAIRVHQAARKTPPLLLKAPPAGTPELTQEVRQKILRAINLYTEDSQFLHYPLRWDITGNKAVVQITDSIQLEYNIMRSEKAGELDPVLLLYINLGALLSYKHPSVAQRVVVTEAVYRQVADDRRPYDDLRGESQIVGEGAVVGMTEVCSVALSSLMATGFGGGLSLGDPHRDRNQKMVVVEQTGINITNHTRLVNTEIIIQPGAVFEVTHVDEKGGDSDPTKTLGQVDYMQQVNTHEWEANWAKWERFSKTQNPDDHVPDDTLIADPRTGHLYTVDSQAKDGKTWISTTNYVLGKPMDKGTDAPTETLARWRFPFTADSVPRTLKDAVHVAILTGEPIVQYLNLAIKNAGHEHWRDMGGFDRKAEKEREEVIQSIGHAEAKRIAQLVNLTDNVPLQDSDDVSDVVLLVVTTLRQPIQIVQVNKGSDGSYGVAANDEGKPIVTTINTTYDKVTLFKTTENLQIQPHMVGVAEDCFLAIHYVNGKQVASPMEGGRTAWALLHVVARSTQLGSKEYNPASGVLVPSTQARKDVGDLSEVMQRFVQTDFIVIQEALVSRLTGDLTLHADDANAPQASTWVRPQGQRPTDEEVDQRTQADALNAMAARTAGTIAWLTNNNHTVAWNGGMGSNCLIISLLQHAYGDYTAAGEELLRYMAAGIRTRMFGMGVCRADGGLLATGPQFDTALNLVNHFVGTNMDISIVCPSHDLLKPQADQYEPGVVNYSGNGMTAPLLILYGNNGYAHFEAVYHAPGAAAQHPAAQHPAAQHPLPRRDSSEGMPANLSDLED